MKIRTHVIVGLTAALGLIGPALAVPEDPVDVPDHQQIDNIPENWDSFFLAEETLAAHKGEHVRKFCLDDDFQANVDGFETDMLVSRTSRNNRVSKIKKLRGNVDFRVVGENTVIITLPVAGDHLVETRFCRRNLRRTKFILFTDSIDRPRLNRCVRRNQTLSIQTRLQNSGYKSCEVKAIYEWNGPDVTEYEELDGELPPIELE